MPGQIRMHPSQPSILESRDRWSAGDAAVCSPTALLLFGKSLSSEYDKLGELLDFFGIPCKAVSIDEIAAEGLPAGKHSILAGAPDVARALRADTDPDGGLPHWILQASSVYIFGFEDTDSCRTLLRFLTADTQASIRRASGPYEFMSITSELPEVCGPMSGMRVPVDSELELLFGVTPRNDGVQSIVDTSGGQVFIRAVCQGVAFYLNVSSQTIDINEPSERQFDVRKAFCSAVPITMYLKWAFRGVCWSSPETNACLIIDDPPLKPRYGFLNFSQLSKLMDEQNFTTAIAFIPWNWRRTDGHTVELLRSRPHRFSLAVHGCDHTANEFATRSSAQLDSKVKLARQRMQSLAQRTSLSYDRVMVFPQGVFSPETGRALKLSGFVGAVNTEVAPYESEGNETKIRDVWDVAIMKYGALPIFTRRYLTAGIENFAFDAILGKPCLITAHHDVFKSQGRDLADFIARLNSLPWNLRWRPLGGALERSFCFRSQPHEIIVIRIFSSTLAMENPTAKLKEIVAMKKESDPGRVEAVTWNDRAIDFNCVDGHLRLNIQCLPEETGRIRIRYLESQTPSAGWGEDAIGYKLKTCLRRYLSEFRDNYVSQSDFLYRTATGIRHLLRG